MYKQGPESQSSRLIEARTSLTLQHLYCSHHRERPIANPDQPSLPFPKCDVRERMWVSLNSNDQKQKAVLPPVKEREKRCKYAKTTALEVAGNGAPDLLEWHADICHRGLHGTGVLRHRHCSAVDHCCHGGQLAPFLFAVARWPSF
jgi:hypothetical protein